MMSNRTEYMQAYRAAHPDKRNRAEYMRVWREKNYAHFLETRRAWGKKNPDKIRKYRLKEHARRILIEPDYQAKYSKAARTRNPERHKKYLEKSAYKDRQRFLITKIHTSARTRGIPCDITKEDLEWPTHCPVLGTELQYDRRGATTRKNAPSFDRLIPSLGYVKGNVFVISNEANSLKRDASLAQLEALVRYVKERLPHG